MFENPNQEMYDHRNQTIDSWGKDSTGQVKYTFDKYGFRNHNNYEVMPECVFFGCSLLFGVGVNTQDVFTSNFQCWNFGLAGRYTEDEILNCYTQFKKLQIDSKVVFVWRSKESLPDLNMLDSGKIYHCVPYKSEHKNHLRLLECLDYDVSGTHYGPQTHKKFSKLLWYFLK